MDLGLAGQVALVAGGGRGVGRAAALALAREGADVAVLARSQEEVSAVAAEARALGRRALALRADLVDAAGTDAALDALRRDLGPPTVLVLSAAGLYHPTRLHDLADDEADALLALDLRAAVRLCSRILPDMLARRTGRIVAVSSVAARTGQPGAPLFGSAKAALEGLCRGLAVDYSRHGITANAVAVGFAESDRQVARDDGEAAEDRAAARERRRRAAAGRRLVTPEEAAAVIAFLCSVQARAITGAVVDVTHGAGLGNL